LLTSAVGRPSFGVDFLEHADHVAVPGHVALHRDRAHLRARRVGGHRLRRGLAGAVIDRHVVAAARGQTRGRGADPA
jgi:hypothetical protein